MKRDIGWLCVVGLLLCSAPLPLFAAPGERATLTGQVTDANNQPIAGVRINVDTAAPKMGAGLFCPSCYRDCRKSTTTDAQGRFTIADLSPDLKFRLVAVKNDWIAKRTSHLDPNAGPALLILEPDDHEQPLATDQRRLRGIVRNEEGLPVAGALVEAIGAKTAQGRRWGDIKESKSTLTDQKGEFAITAPKNIEALEVTITAAGYCGNNVMLNAHSTSSEPATIVLPEGASVTGRVVHDGVPVTQLPIAVCQVDKTSQGGIFVKDIVGITDAHGSFTLSHLPPDEQYCLYTPVGESRRGSRDAEWVLATKLFQAPSSRKTRDLGTLEAVAPVSLSGRLTVQDNQPIPKSTQVTLSRQPAWDLIELAIASDGTFNISGMPPETYEINVVNDRLRLAPALTYQVTGPRSLAVHVDHPINQLDIPLDVDKKDPTLAGEPLPKSTNPVVKKPDPNSKVAEASTTIAGRVLFQGNPLPDAGLEVKLFRLAPPDEQGGSAIIHVATQPTDLAGRFSLSGLHQGDEYYLEIETPRHLRVHHWPYLSPWIKKVDAIDGSTIVLPDAELIAFNREIVGRCIGPDGRPAQGFSISARFASGESLPLSFEDQVATSDAGGQFLLRNLPDSPLQIFVWRQGARFGQILAYTNEFCIPKGTEELRIVVDPKLGTGIENLDVAK